MGGVIWCTLNSSLHSLCKCLTVIKQNLAKRMKKISYRSLNWGKVFFSCCLFVAAVALTSCEKDETSPLIGFWAEPDAGMKHSTASYEFINHNTVVSYGETVLKEYESEYNQWKNFDPHPCDSRYVYGGRVDTWTYVYEDNKVIITDGTILTLRNGKLYPDGSSGYLIKIN